MQIFDYEKEDGIGEAIASRDKISIATVLSEVKDHKIVNKKLLEMFGAQASIHDEDLFYIEYILCSTVTNLNQDCFLPEEVWAARNTPTHKPINLQHQAAEILGHCISSYAINAETGDRINDAAAIDQLPAYYHLLASGVLYKKLADKDLQSRASEVIQKIKSGEIFVSMECLFSSFSHLLEDAKGNRQILPRNKENLKYTKALRAYGGSGEIDGYKVSRVLRNILFSAAGLVDKPANPDSIITFSKGMLDITSKDSNKLSTINNNSEKDGVLITKSDTNNNEVVNMADNTDKFEKEITDLKVALKAAQDQLTEVGKEKYESQIEDLKAQLKTAEAKDAEYKTNLDKLANELTEANKKIEEINQAKSNLETELTKIQTESMKANRVSELVSAGVDKTEATVTVEKFAFLNDEQFKSVAELAIAASKMKKEDKKDDKKDDSYASDKNGEKNADEKLIEDAKAGKKDPDLSTSANTRETAIAQLSERLSGLMKNRKVAASK